MPGFSRFEALKAHRGQRQEHGCQAASEPVSARLRIGTLRVSSREPRLQC